jgi:hypothetical protein
MVSQSALPILALAVFGGCSVYDKTLLAPAEDTIEAPSTGAGGSIGTGGASTGKDGSPDARADVSVIPDGSSGGAAGAGGVIGTGGTSGVGGTTDAAGGAAGCTPPSSDHAMLNTGPILATFESGGSVETAVSPSMYWYAYDDGTSDAGTPPGPFAAVPRLPVEDGNRYAGHFTGTLHTGYGGGIGVSSVLPIDGSGYTGVSFWAKGTGGVRLLVSTTATDGTYCKCAGTDCGDGYLKEVVLTADWAQYTVKYTALTQMHHAVLFDPTGITAFNFAASAQSWDYWIDDLAFAP